MATRAERTAEAFEAVAAVNHYMVGYVGDATLDEIYLAEEILVDRQNGTDQTEYPETWARLELALDLITQHRTRLEREG